MPSVAIVNYGLGNLFSVQRACETVGLDARITAQAREVLAADAVILPGVGAFGDAMCSIQRLDLAAVLRDAAQRGTPLLGICLGMQLLMRESEEFGRHRGLGIVEGEVVHFGRPVENGRASKVPHVAWDRIHAGRASWQGTWLEGLRDGEFMYFVHSYVVRPQEEGCILSTSHYGDVEFCSTMKQGSVLGAQYHPERSGAAGLRVYANLANTLREKMTVA